MKLNLHILKEDLSAFHFQGTLIDSPVVMNCAYPKLCETAPKQFSEDVLYILKAEFLPKRSEINSNPSIICIGQPDQSWTNTMSNLLYTLDAVTTTDILNRVNERFYFYQEWENSLQQVIDKKLPLQELAVRSKDLIKNPIHAQGNSFTILFSYIPKLENAQSKYLNYFEKYSYALNTHNTILDNDDINCIISDSSYEFLCKAISPSLYPGDLFSVHTLFYNVYLNNILIARLYIDDLLHPIKKSDYSFIVILGKYLLKSLSNSCINFIEHPKDLDTLLQDLLSQELVPDENINSVLETLQWKSHDSYVCFNLKVKMKIDRNILSAIAFNLSTELKNICYTIIEDEIIFVYNLSKFHLSKEQLISKIMSILQKNLLTAGISIPYRDFVNLYYYYQQTIFALECGCKKNPKDRLYCFEDYQIEYLIHKYTINTIQESLIPEGLQTLIAYDRYKGTKYTNLLRIYLSCERNIAKTIRATFMARSTFLYQIEKIQNIIKLDLDNSDVRLILKVAFNVLEDENVRANGEIYTSLQGEQ